MSKPLSHSDYWCLQAKEARLAAQRLEDPKARETCSRRRMNMTGSRLQQRVGNPAAH